MAFEKGPNNDNHKYVDKATITVRMENGAPVVEPEIVYLNNGGEIHWNFVEDTASGCEIRFRTSTNESCPFVFPQSTGCSPAEEGCFTFSKAGQFQSFANRKQPKLDIEVWEYDVVVGDVVYDPVIRLKNTPDAGG